MAEDTKLGRCPGCGDDGELVLAPSMTNYADKTKNKPFWCCRQCRAEHCAQMTELWADYNADINEGLRGL